MRLYRFISYVQDPGSLPLPGFYVEHIDRFADVGRRSWIVRAGLVTSQEGA